MSDDYLWDRSGPPDPTVARLERTLGVLRASDAPPTFPAAPPKPRRRAPLLVGAAVACAAAVLVVAWPRRAAPPAVVMPMGWEVAVLSGAPRIAGRVVSGTVGLAPAQLMETDARSSARLEVPSIGTVDVQPGTALSLVAGETGPHRIRLERGTIHALIWSPPGTFFVETPAGTAVDLGCEYTVTVNDRGDGMLAVLSGWVGFDRGGRESFVPAGAECPLRQMRGPGTPRRTDAPAPLRQALDVLDAPDGPDEQARALATVLKEASTEDAFTLWHLLQRVPLQDRAPVHRRLAALVPQVAEVDGARILAGDRAALDQLWDRLGLDPIAQWRRWKAARP